MTDGLQHVDQLGTPARLRRRVAAGLLPPLAAVFVESGTQRAATLGVPGGHARWIAETLLPRLREQGLDDGRSPVRLAPEPARTVVTGVGLGGLTALFAVARAPELIGAAIAQSVPLARFPQGALVGPLRAADRRRPLRLRLHAGGFEGPLAEQAEDLVTALRTDDVDAALAVHGGGHDWAWWQPTMLHELAALLR